MEQFARFQWLKQSRPRSEGLTFLTLKVLICQTVIRMIAGKKKPGFSTGLFFELIKILKV